MRSNNFEVVENGRMGEFICCNNSKIIEKVTDAMYFKVSKSENRQYDNAVVGWSAHSLDGGL